MANVALDAALDELGMLSTVTNSRQEYITEQLSRLTALDILQDHNICTRGSNLRMRTRANSASTVLGRKIMKKMITRTPVLPYYKDRDNCRRSRTRSENESELSDHLSYYTANQHSCLDPVPYIALPIDSVLSSNLFKSRSMESIDARTNDESASAIEAEVPNAVASLAEVDSVSNKLHRLNVSE